MTSFFPHPAYAEDQPYAHIILTDHVLHRGLQAGALVGFLSGSARSVLASRRPPPTQVPLHGVSSAPLANAAANPLTRAVNPTAMMKTLRATGVGAMWGIGFIAIGLQARMWGRKEIEWQDRSWRLLANRGQVMCDDWSLGGMGIGALATMVREQGAKQAGKGVRILGGAGMGNLAGVVGYMVYRYGVQGEKMS